MNEDPIDPFKVSQTNTKCNKIHLNDQPNKWKRTNSIKFIILSLPRLIRSAHCFHFGRKCIRKLLNCHCNRWATVRRPDDESSHLQKNSLLSRVVVSLPPLHSPKWCWYIQLKLHRFNVVAQFLITFSTSGWLLFIGVGTVPLHRCSFHGTICSHSRPILRERLWSAMLSSFSII